MDGATDRARASAVDAVEIDGEGTTRTTASSRDDGVDVDAIVGDARALEASTPSWFDPRAFEGDDFDPWAYVEETSSFVGEDAMREALDAYEKEVKARLEVIVRDNYEEFASLGDGLRDFEELRREIEPEAKATREVVRAEREAIARALERLEANAAEREARARASESKRLAEECTHTVSKVERLLGELDVGEKVSVSSGAQTSENVGEVFASVTISAEDREGLDLLEPAFDDEQATTSGGDAAPADEMHQSHVSDDVNERARLLDRISSEVNRLKFYQKQGKDLATIRDLADRIEYCELKLTSLVQTALIDGLKEKNAHIISHCLHACAAIGKMDVVENVVRTTLIQPAVEKAIDSAGEEHFDSILPQLGEAAIASCSNVLELTRAPDAGLHTVDFLAGTVLAEVDAQVSAARQHAYSPGMPHIFIKNYRAAMAFVDRLEELAPTPSSLNYFRASKHLTTYIKRWDLRVYFSLRFNEYATTVEEELNQPGLDTSLASDGFLLASTTQAWLTMCKCTSDDVFVPALADKFVRLFAQVLSRYKTWVNSGMDALAMQQNAEKGAEESAVSVGGTNWGATAGGDELILVRLDIEKLCERVRSDGADRIKTSISILGDEATKLALDCILEGVEDLSAIIPRVDTFIVKVHVDRCVEALKQLKGITATFRMTNKPMPTRHSHFVPSILAPLQTFVDNERTKALSKTSTHEIVTQVVETVCEKYGELARDLLETVKKTEASLNRLKDRQGKASNAGTGDSDKICRQLYLDAKEFETQMKKFGVDPRDSNAFRALWEAVEAGAPEISA